MEIIISGLLVGGILGLNSAVKHMCKSYLQKQLKQGNKK